MTGQNVSRSFVSEGRYEALAVVRFEVAYRFDSGADWVIDPGRILLTSNLVSVEVGARGINGQVRLVNRSCLELGNAAGCRNP